VLGDLPVPNDQRVLIDYRTSDDAGVYRLDEERALVQTVDFFTPIVDDPFVYGQIAAANALSDVYAMGGRPLTALAIAAFPKDGDATVLKAIFRGGFEKLLEAGVPLLGGHTVQDMEIKFGYAVTGEVALSNIWSNAGARPGDDVILTKPLGTGIVSTAVKYGRAPASTVATAISSMTTLNRVASDTLRSLPEGTVHGCTDVTGFGLLGHASEMAVASRCTLEIDAAAVPLLPGARELVDGNIPGGGRTNAQHFGRVVDLAADLDPDLVQLLFDPQTSGGLLVTLDRTASARAVELLVTTGVPAVTVGRAVPRNVFDVIVR
jgi:selenide, water dikinase